ncbi:MAG: DUF4038 domain-containing protein [Sphingobacteriaceae bacterium]|nr:DUF4038 domain-containing protein [Sphingobacteriaceae bacterium]
MRDWENFGSQDDRVRYLRYIVGRYSAYNIYWILAGEYDEAPSIDFNSLGTQLARHDPHDRMIAVHTTHSSEEFADASWSGFGDYQQRYYDLENLHAFALASRDHNKPIVQSEYAYYLCDRDSNGQVDYLDEIMPWTRRQAWNIAMSGSYFITGFGATVLGGLRHDWAFTDMNHQRYDDWEEQVGYIKTFFEDLEYWRLTPNDALITSGTGTHHALYEVNSVYIIYAYNEVISFQVDLSDAEGSYEGKRFDPRTGNSTSLGSYIGGDTITISVPDTNDYCYKFTRI